jgi:hypothetical protein
MLLGIIAGAIVTTLLVVALFSDALFPPLPTLVPTMPGLAMAVPTSTVAPLRATHTATSVDTAEPEMAAMVSEPTALPIRPSAAPVTDVTPATVAHITAVGDSVMLGAALELQRLFDDMDIDARVGRQPAAALDILRQRCAAGQLGPVVIVHIGNNGDFTERQIAEMMQLLADAHQILLVNVKVPRDWENSNNARLAQIAQQYPNVKLVDWYQTSLEHPELLYDDGVHLRPAGAKAYAALIAAALAP